MIGEKVVHTFAGLAFLVGAAPAFAEEVICNTNSYSPQLGLSARTDANGIQMDWAGANDQELRLGLGVIGGKPVIQELALKRSDGTWVTLLKNASPDFSVTTGLRRMSNQQLEPLSGLGEKITQDVLNKYRWDPFWDAPLDLSPPRVGGFAGNPPPADGIPGTDQPGLPRRPEEIQRADASYSISSCSIKTDGARLEVTLPGVHLGLFEGALRYTIFKGTNLIRQEVVATTRAPWVAYKYSGGIKDISVNDGSRIAWRDTSNTWQSYQFGGEVTPQRVPLQAYNRLVVAQQGNEGSIAAFPPPHKFFWSREVAVNMGYNYYQKETASTYSIGVRQNDHEELSEGQGNWALYSARPGTQQLMTVFLYPSLQSANQTSDQVLAFTHGDRYKPLPGYQVMQHHYHMDMGERLLAEKNLSYRLPDLVAIKALGINIVSQIDSVMLRGFSATGVKSSAPAPQRALAAPPRRPNRPDQISVTAASVEGARLSSDKGFLVMADQEVFGSPLGGHTDLLFKHPVYWDQRKSGQPFKESSEKFGKIYHIGDATDFMKMVDAEDIMVSMPHPRTKGSTGFPDAIKDRAYFNDPHYQGIGLRWGMGIDGSEIRTCEYRCLALMDDMSNWVVDRPEPLKYAISISEVRHQQPGDDIYAGSPVTYVHLAELPPANDPSPVIDALMKGDMFITTGEVLVPRFQVTGTGSKQVAVADVEWTFPLDFVELVWGDGKRTGRITVSATSLPAFGSHRFEIPFDAKGKKWVRFAAWDSAYEGAILQPQRLGPQPRK